MLGGETIADSRRIKLLHEQGHLPVYYFPEEDVRMDLLEAMEHTTHCPFKGDASYWSVRAGYKVAKNTLAEFCIQMPLAAITIIALYQESAYL
jgi:uncharacterized protein (DUF427 family)